MVKLLVLVIAIVLCGCATSQIACNPDNPPEGYICMTEKEWASISYAVFWMDAELASCWYQLEQMGGEAEEEKY